MNNVVNLFLSKVLPVYWIMSGTPSFARVNHQMGSRDRSKRVSGTGICKKTTLPAVPSSEVFQI